MVNKTLKVNFGTLECTEGPEETFVWPVRIAVNNRFFEGEMPLYILTKTEDLSVNITGRAEVILDNMENYLETGYPF